MDGRGMDGEGTGDDRGARDDVAHILDHADATSTCAQADVSAFLVAEVQRGEELLTGQKDTANTKLKDEEAGQNDGETTNGKDEETEQKDQEAREEETKQNGGETRKRKDEESGHKDQKTKQENSEQNGGGPKPTDEETYSVDRDGEDARSGSLCCDDRIDSAEFMNEPAIQAAALQRLSPAPSSPSPLALPGHGGGRQPDANDGDAGVDEGDAVAGALCGCDESYTCDVKVNRSSLSDDHVHDDIDDGGGGGGDGRGEESDVEDNGDNNDGSMSSPNPGSVIPRKTTSANSLRVSSDCDKLEESRSSSELERTDVDDNGQTDEVDVGGGSPGLCRDGAMSYELQADDAVEQTDSTALGSADPGGAPHPSSGLGLGVPSPKEDDEHSTIREPAVHRNDSPTGSGQPLPPRASSSSERSRVSGRQVVDEISSDVDEFGSSVDPAKTGDESDDDLVVPDRGGRSWEDGSDSSSSGGSEFQDVVSNEEVPMGWNVVTEVRRAWGAEAEECTTRDPRQRPPSTTTMTTSRNDGLPSDDEDFFDALDHQVEQEFEVALPHNKDKLHRRTGSDLSMDSYANDMSSESESEGSVNEARVYTTKANSPKKLLRQGSGKRDHKRQGSQDKIRVPRSSSAATETAVSTVSTNCTDVGQRRKRRKWITEKPNISLNLWSVMKNCIGKELSKIPMPVNFSEPLSMLQRLTEELEYSEILDQAALCEDSCEQLAYVAAFTVSAYATTLFRTGKPFNPLLGETFEFDRTEDFGWRSLAEQVSHHPPTLATHAEGRGWTLWQEFTMTTKFRGRYLQIIPMGIAHLTFSKSGGHYTWRKVTTTVHNIIVGRLWVDNQGEMDITNHTSGDKCHLKYSAYSYFSREPPRKVTGVVTDSQENARWVLTGNWCTKMEGAPIIHVEESNKGKPVFETGPHKLLWKVRPPPPGAERIYFFSQLAIEMNEPEEGVAPTDSRNRPDQRMMEEGKWDEANRLKFLLEEKQRAARRQREAEAEKLKAQGLENKVYRPTWFQKENDPITGSLLHVFNGKYWDCKAKQQWEGCPDIYL